MSKIDTKVKTYEIVFKEKQTVTLEDGNGEIIKNVLAFFSFILVRVYYSIFY